MKKGLIHVMVMGFILLGCGTAWGHFGMLIPSDNMVVQGDNRNLNLTLSFSHPMEMIGMDMQKPEGFQVVSPLGTQDLLAQLKPIQVMDRKAWSLDYRLRRPGVYIFHMQPQPYWEPTEDCFIIHYTKTVVSAFGDDEGWDTALGLKTEIVPLSRPFGLYAGNLFQGIVYLNGNSIPYATVEVEYYNQHKTAQAPTEYMVTQTIKADQNGVFSYAVPRSGWWGFAALNSADFTMKTKNGVDKDVELGAVIWVHFEEWR
jgi:cobalt/nickel transport protein